jgi:hypothetical protein
VWLDFARRDEMDIVPNLRTLTIGAGAISGGQARNEAEDVKISVREIIGFEPKNRGRRMAQKRIFLSIRI